MSRVEGVLEDAITLARLDGIHKILRLRDLRLYLESDYVIEVYSIDEDLRDDFRVVKELKERVCYEISIIHARGHGSLALCSRHKVPVIGADGSIIDKEASHIKPGDFLISFVRNTSYYESKRHDKSLISLSESKEEGVFCSSRVDELALHLWSMRIAGVLSSLSQNTFCFKTYSSKNRPRIEKIPLAPFLGISRLLGLASRRSKSAKHILSHIRRKAVSKAMASTALRDLLSLNLQPLSETEEKTLENLTRLSSSNLYGVLVSSVEHVEVKDGIRALVVEVENAPYIFIGLSPLLVG